jgi:hypothetical protein
VARRVRKYIVYVGSEGTSHQGDSPVKSHSIKGEDGAMAEPIEKSPSQGIREKDWSGEKGREDTVLLTAQEGK